MSKHTPGPWTVTQNFRGMAGVWPDSPGTNKPICMLAHDPDGPSKGPFENWQANANLIAAAPELLEALVEAVELIEFHMGSTHSETDEDEELVVKMAESAIAKAEGRTE